MPGMIRPNLKLAKLAYKLLNIPKDMQQKDNPKIDEKRRQSWFRDSSAAQ